MASSSEVYTGKRTRDGKLCNVQDLKEGDVLSCTIQYTVKGISPDKLTVHLKSTDGSHSHVSASIVESKYYTLEVVESKKVTHTVMAETIIPNAVASVCQMTFTKKPNPKDGSALLTGLDPEDLKNEAKRRKIAKDIQTGKERVIRCVIMHIDNMGRAHVVDLEIDGEHKDRQVDTRTVTECIYRNVRYHV